MFDSIWKDQIQKPKGKLGIWKPKEELRPREEEEKDDKCCKDAKDELLKWYPTSLGQREEIKKYTCEEFREELKKSIIKYYDDTQMSYLEKDWGAALKEILEEWEECENGN